MAYMGTYYVHRITEENTTMMITAILSQKTKSLDNCFISAESAVDTLIDYVSETTDPNRLQSEEKYRSACMVDIKQRLVNAAKMNGYVITAYFRPDPEVYGSTEGVFLAKDDYNGYSSITPTDILAYDRDDIGRVGWYYYPKEYGQAVWMEPYNNENLNIYMITYAGPVYVKGQYLGIIGMDVAMDTILSEVDSVEFEQSFGFIVNDKGDIIYHKDYPEGLKSSEFNEELREASEFFTPTAASRHITGRYKWQGELYRISTTKLDNNMIFVLSVPESELTKPENNMWIYTAISFIVVAIVTLLLILHLSRTIVAPIKEITAASERISKGELNVTINYRSRDEIGLLAESVRDMSHELRDYISYIQNQAFTDAMTGVGNKAAYMDQVSLLSRKIYEGMADFAVVVFDINGLKKVNDNMGHEFGDALIADAAMIIKYVFGAENTYRIGGDEFIVILENVTRDDMDRLYADYRVTIDEFNEKEHRYATDLIISKGCAFYNESDDKEYKEVFKRADEEMYKEKEQFYQGRNDRRRR